MQEKRFYFLVEISLICENVMSVMSEGLTSAASESTMRLISGSVTATRELSAIKGCDLSTRATYLRVYTVSEKKWLDINYDTVGRFCHYLNISTINHQHENLTYQIKMKAIPFLDLLIQ